MHKRRITYSRTTQTFNQTTQTSHIDQRGIDYLLTRQAKNLNITHTNTAKDMDPQMLRRHVEIETRLTSRLRLRKRVNPCLRKHFTPNTSCIG
jgi:phenylalanyl-tRNA synthetase beta subunit